MKQFFYLFIAFTLSGCVSSSVLFQDGRTLGQDEFNVALSASYNFTPEYNLDSANSKVNINPDRFPAPWIQLQGQYGLVDRMDVGASVGVGLLSFGMQGFTKFSLFENERFGVSILGLAGFSTLNENEIDPDEGSVFYHNFMGALPISYRLNPSNEIVVQPIFSRDNYRYNVPDGTRKIIGNHHNLYYKLGLGYIRENKNKNRIFYNVTLGYYQERDLILPTVGIAFFPD